MDFPQGTQDLYDLLGAHHHDDHGAHGPVDHAHDQNPEEHLKGDKEEKFPDYITSHAMSSEGESVIAEEHAPAQTAGHADHAADEKVVSVEKDTHTIVIKKSNLKKWAKVSWPYITIFVVALFFFLVLFTNFSVTSFFSAPKAAKTTEQTNYPNMDAYNAWISSYFYEVTDSKILDPNNDISGNGLTNYQKFVLGLNPKRTDTMGLGMSDSQALIEGINPLTGNTLSYEQKKLVAQYVDLEALSNKMTLASLTSAGQVAGATTADQQDLSGNSVQIDTNYNGTLNIPSLNITVPVIWTKSTNNFDTDLQNGIVHYPGTAMPGQMGTSYISGHSSNYSWAKGSYNQIFATLGNLKQYDGFTITVRDTSGRTDVLHYVVTNSQIYKADDQAQFASQDKSIVALSTCWPIGTSQKRLVVFGELSQTDHQ